LISFVNHPNIQWKHILSYYCIAAFAAGFIDAIVGGGGLIQTLQD
jgi:uncharacterized membrane protein YfcA